MNGKSKNIYEDIFNNPSLLSMMNLSKLTKEYKYQQGNNKDVLGKFKDETMSKDGIKTITEFTSLEAKMYAIKFGNVIQEKKIEKGIKRKNIKKLTCEDFFLKMKKKNNNEHNKSNTF